MLTVRNAILHAFDFDTGSVFLSDHELDMDEKLVKSYVRRHLRRCVTSDQNMHGEFAETSNFSEEMRLYLSHQTSFLELSKQIANFFWETLRKCDDLVQADLLVADFEETETKKDADEDEEALERSFSGETNRRFAVILLPRSQTFMHSIEHPSGGSMNEIVRHDATLPNPSSKVDTYALIDCDSLAIDFRDKARTIAEAEVWVIQNMFLQCSREPSSHEVIKTVQQIVEDITETAPLGTMNTVEALSRTKACVAHSAELDERVEPKKIGEQVFVDMPELLERYEQATEEFELPEEISVGRAAARRLTKNHRIRTDTGIDITFPSEYSSESRYLRFERQEDGTVSIIIGHVQSIENR